MSEPPPNIKYRQTQKTKARLYKKILVVECAANIDLKRRESDIERWDLDERYGHSLSSGIGTLASQGDIGSILHFANISVVHEFNVLVAGDNNVAFQRARRALEKQHNVWQRLS